MNAIFTIKMLTDARVCSDKVELFHSTFGDSVNVTVARASKVADKFDWDFAVRFLDSEGRVEYERVRGAAWAEYKRVRDAARVEYKRVRGAAWASAYIATCKRRKAAQVLA